jgi:cysteine sulfinate desulfinase/cysteine desulfurase-like protein
LRALDFHDPTRASVRFSFSRYTTEEEVDRALAAVEKVFG